MKVTLDIFPYFVHFIVAFILVGFFSKTTSLFGVDDNIGVQKFHTNKISRMGGVSIAISIFIGIFLMPQYYHFEAFLTFILMLAFMPIFIGGFVEDLTRKVSPKIRLLLSFISSFLFIYFTDVKITHTDIKIVDYALQSTGVNFIVTILIISGFLNSINILDGFHGLACGTVNIILISFLIISFIVSDYFLFKIILLVIISNTAFLLWNWPQGKIFLGDSGSYLLGIWVVAFGILIPHRSTDISPLATVLIGSYPMIETLFSIYRRKFIRSHPISHPDALHLHTLIYRRLIYKKSSDINKNSLNAKVALFIWPYILINSFIAIFFMKNTSVLLLFIIISFGLYSKLYSLIVKFKTPKFLR